MDKDLLGEVARREEEGEELTLGAKRDFEDIFHAKNLSPDEIFSFGAEDELNVSSRKRDGLETQSQVGTHIAQGVDASLPTAEEDRNGLEVSKLDSSTSSVLDGSSSSPAHAMHTTKDTLTCGNETSAVSMLIAEEKSNRAFEPNTAKSEEADETSDATKFVSLPAVDTMVTDFGSAHEYSELSNLVSESPYEATSLSSKAQRSPNKRKHEDERTDIEYAEGSCTTSGGAVRLADATSFVFAPGDITEKCERSSIGNDKGNNIDGIIVDNRDNATTTTTNNDGLSGLSEGTYLNYKSAEKQKTSDKADLVVHEGSETKREVELLRGTLGSLETRQEASVSTGGLCLPPALEEEQSLLSDGSLASPVPSPPLSPREILSRITRSPQHSPQRARPRRPRAKSIGSPALHYRGWRKGASPKISASGHRLSSRGYTQLSDTSESEENVQQEARGCREARRGGKMNGDEGEVEAEDGRAEAKEVKGEVEGTGKERDDKDIEEKGGVETGELLGRYSATSGAATPSISSSSFPSSSSSSSAFQSSSILPPPSSSSSSGAAFDLSSPSRRAKRARRQLGLREYVSAEIFGVPIVGSDEAVRHAQVQNFLHVPLRVEKFLFYGSFVALDCFLYVYTFLPIRIVVACGKGVLTLTRWRDSPALFHRNHLYDVMRGLIMVIVCYALYHVDISRVYHYIRGQAMIKLYVLSAMIEMRFTTLYVQLLRCTISFLSEMVTLNVAINSSNSALLTLLVSNNFSELKSSVFKKYEEQNLFQIACSDITERFKLTLMVLLISIQNWSRDGFLDNYGHVGRGALLVLAAEVLVDWIKHAFISKFNRINPDVYSKFTTVLCRDFTLCRKENVILDHTHAASRRLGLVALPLACVMVKMGLIAFDAASVKLSSPSGIVILVLLFLCLFAIKVLTSLLLMAHASRSGRVVLPDSLESPAQGNKRLERLASTQRFTLVKDRIV